MNKSETTRPINGYTTTDLMGLYDLLYAEDEYVVQNEIRIMLKICTFNPEKFRSHLTKYIRYHRNSKFSVTYFEAFKKDLYMPFKELPLAISDTYSQHFLLVIRWRLTLGV